MTGGWCKLPSEVTTGWLVVAEGASVTPAGVSDTVHVVSASEFGVTASVVPPTPVGSVASTVPPGVGVAELTGSPLVKPALVVELKGGSVAAAAAVRHPQKKTMNM